MSHPLPGAKPSDQIRPDEKCKACEPPLDSVRPDAVAASGRERHMTALEAALQYAYRGWRVIPCRSNKIPRIRNWPVAASCDPETIITWWTQWPNAWIALLCGCGFVVIDVDTGEAHNNVDGFGTLAQLGPLPETRRVRTPTGGSSRWKRNNPVAHSWQKLNCRSPFT